jgi:hypothetical protein
MPINLYRNRLRDFEKKNHTELRNIFSELSYEWLNYETKHNEKIEIDYENFVKYCYEVSNVRPKPIVFTK